MTYSEKLKIVSILNSLVEAYCDKYPEEYSYENNCFGVVDGKIQNISDDDLKDCLEWIHAEVVPDLLNK